jgi:hypothetical protein
MPPKHLLKHALACALNHIPMTRHNPLKSPSVDPAHTRIEPRAIARTRAIPNRAFLPHRAPRRTLQRAENLGQNPTARVFTCPAELLGGWQVEHHVGLNQRLCGFVVEHDFLVDVCGDVFPVKLGVEFRRDGIYGHALLEDEGEGNVFIALLFTLLGERFRAEDLGGRVGGVPGAEEDVVLEGELVDVKGVYDGGRTSASSAAMYFTSPSSETLDLTSSVRATGEKTARAPDWRRTAVDVSRIIRFEEHRVHTDSAASANLNSSKAPERNGKCRDGSGNDIANDHDLGRVRGY